MLIKRKKGYKNLKLTILSTDYDIHAVESPLKLIQNQYWFEYFINNVHMHRDL